MSLNKIKGYEAKFIKKNGEERNMTFVKVPDLPDDFVKAKIKALERKENLAERWSWCGKLTKINLASAFLIGPQLWAKLKRFF